MMLMIVVIMRLYHGTCSSVDNEDEFLKPIHTLKESMPFCLPVPQLSDSCLAAGSRTLSLGSMLSQGVKRGRASSGDRLAANCRSYWACRLACCCACWCAISRPRCVSSFFSDSFVWPSTRPSSS
eukprot:COSAG01_NODE_1985_length_8724_cov_304.696928_2_plen_125_part_00